MVEYLLQFEPGALPIEVSQSLIFQVLTGVKKLHEENILHRDLKLDNILFKDRSREEIRIIDFDMGLLLDVAEPPKLLPRQEVSIVGTKDYMVREGL